MQRVSQVALVVKNPPAKAEGMRWGVEGHVIQSLSPEDPLEEVMATHSQYSCLENPMDRGAWQALLVHRVIESDMTKAA